MLQYLNEVSRVPHYLPLEEWGKGEKTNYVVCGVGRMVMTKAEEDWLLVFFVFCLLFFGGLLADQNGCSAVYYGNMLFRIGMMLYHFFFCRRSENMAKNVDYGPTDKQGANAWSSFASIISCVSLNLWIVKCHQGIIRTLRHSDYGRRNPFKILFLWLILI